MSRRMLNLPTLQVACIELSERDPLLCISFESYGTPPLWNRPQGFATLLQIILEQQVSLASARACFNKLAASIENVSPENLLKLGDAELKAAGISRQKAEYARHLAKAVAEKTLDFALFGRQSDDELRSQLKTLKGVGDWTADIYLLMAMLRPDVMPKGDLALHIAWQKLSGRARPDAVEFLEIAERWKPYRSVAARMLWHFYLSDRSRRKDK